jgi:hypothetical protein
MTDQEIIERLETIEASLALIMRVLTEHKRVAVRTETRLVILARSLGHGDKLGVTSLESDHDT